jgi:hypothetical protein
LTGLIYKSTSAYELSMKLLYGRFYQERYRVIASLIPDGSSVVDLCCGPATLFTRNLAHRQVQYTGLDINPGFIRRLCRSGGNGLVWDLRDDKPLPAGEYVIMHASLYHFLPDAGAVVDRMLAASTERVIIAEPVRNMASSRNRVVALAARILTDPGQGAQGHRFDAQTLDRFFEGYRDRINTCFLMPGGREKAYVLDPALKPEVV